MKDKKRYIMGYTENGKINYVCGLADNHLGYSFTTKRSQARDWDIRTVNTFRNLDFYHSFFSYPIYEEEEIKS